MLELMRRYVFGFVNAHNPEEARRIMAPDYTLVMGRDVLQGRDAEYVPAVLKQLDKFPWLQYTIHELLWDGDFVATRFSEHGAPRDNPEIHAAWQGIAIYRREGDVLRQCWVEQDHFGRRHQIASGRGAVLDSVPVSVWDRAIRVAVERSLYDQAEAWAQQLTSWPPAELNVDDTERLGPEPLIDVTRTEINARVAQGSRSALHCSIHGLYHGGLTNDPSHMGRKVRLDVGIILRIQDGVVDSIAAVSNRVDLLRQLRVGEP